MKIVLFSVLTILCLSTAYGQRNDDLKGKWKIITIDAGFFHDFRNDSTFYSKEFLETLKGSEDSTFMMGFFDGMISSFSNYYYEFKDNNQFEEKKNGRSKGKGTYVLTGTDTIVFHTKDTMGKETTQTLLFKLSDKILLLKVPSEDMEIKIQLSKSD